MRNRKKIPPPTAFLHQGWDTITYTYSTVPPCLRSVTFLQSAAHILCNGRTRSGYPERLRSGITAHARETVFSKIQSSLDAAEGGASPSTPIYKEVYHPRIKKSSVLRDSLFISYKKSVAGYKSRRFHKNI